MNKTKIEYLDLTWNPTAGCSGNGCAVGKNCWAYGIAKRNILKCELCRSFVPHVHYERFDEPLQRKKPVRIGVSFMGEFYDNEIAENIRAELYMTMEKAYWHTFIIFTKQPQNIDTDEPLPKNVHIGVTVNLKKDLWRIDQLRQVQTAVRIISAEPLYEELDGINLDGIGWVIIGAQTRPLLLPNYEWVLGLIQNAGRHKIPTFVKNNLEPIMARTPLLQQFPQVN